MGNDHWISFVTVSEMEVAQHYLNFGLCQSWQSCLISYRFMSPNEQTKTNFLRDIENACASIFEK